MRILGHIHTFNDEDVIEQSLHALLDQTHPVDEVVIVDNGSTDATLERSFPSNVTVIQHEKNLGTSGSVVTGFKYALENNFAWVWLMDADSAPPKDGLEKLLTLYKGFSLELKEKTRMLAGLPVDGRTGIKYQGMVFNAKGNSSVEPLPGQYYYEFDSAIWTGCLYKVESIRELGLPSMDYVLDWGEFEYGYRGKLAGQKAFMIPSCVIDHNIGGHSSLYTTTHRIGPFKFRFLELPPIRCFYLIRNMIYFWFYEFKPRRFTVFFPKLVKILALTLNFMVRPLSHKNELIACLRGIRDGFMRKIETRY